jgi:hypothetical protein
MILAWMTHITVQQGYVPHIYCPVTAWVRGDVTTPIAAKGIGTWMTHIAVQQGYVSHVYYPVTAWVRRDVTTLSHTTTECSVLPSTWDFIAPGIE